MNWTAITEILKALGGLIAVLSFPVAVLTQHEFIMATLRPCAARANRWR